MNVLIENLSRRVCGPCEAAELEERFAAVCRADEIYSEAWTCHRPDRAADSCEKSLILKSDLVLTVRSFGGIKVLQEARRDPHRNGTEKAASKRHAKQVRH